MFPTHDCKFLSAVPGRHEHPGQAQLSFAKLSELCSFLCFSGKGSRSLSYAKRGTHGLAAWISHGTLSTFALLVTVPLATTDRWPAISVKDFLRSELKSGFQQRTVRHHPVIRNELRHIIAA